MTSDQARRLQSQLTNGETLELLIADWGVPLPLNPFSSIDGALALCSSIRGGKATYIIFHNALILSHMKAIDLMKENWMEHFPSSIIELLLQTFISPPKPHKFHQDLDEIDLGI